MLCEKFCIIQQTQNWYENYVNIFWKTSYTYNTQNEAFGEYSTMMILSGDFFRSMFFEKHYFPYPILMKIPLIVQYKMPGNCFWFFLRCGKYISITRFWDSAIFYHLWISLSYVMNIRCLVYTKCVSRVLYLQICHIIC